MQINANIEIFFKYNILEHYAMVKNQTMRFFKNMNKTKIIVF